MTTSLPDGVYIGLPDERYFEQDRLGSTDLSVLHRDPASWWYRSRFNPARAEREVTPEMQFGSALHLLVLEGEEAYGARAVLSPFEDFRTKEARIWRDEQLIAGRVIMTEDMDRRCRHMAALILNHPELGQALERGLSEVSILWTHESGLRLRARFDKLLPLFTVDLKTFGGDARGKTIRQQCTGIIAQRDYDVQRYIYDIARMRMAAMIADGKVFGANPEQTEWLQRVGKVDEWSWCWIFYRRRDDKAGHAPIVQPIIRPSLDVTFETGRRKVAAALQNYGAFLHRFGCDVPWAVIEPAWKPLDHEFPSWLGDVIEPEPAPALEAAE